MLRITHWPEAIWRTGTERLTLMSAHPYHRCIRRVDNHGAGAYVIAFEPHCPLCREERKGKEPLP